MSQRFTGRTVLVTGSASGIGAQTVRRFAAEGASVVVADRNEAGAKRVAAEIVAAGGTALAVSVDVTVSSSIDAMLAATVAAYGSLQVLVNNAMVCGPSRYLEAPEAELRSDIEVNLVGPVLVTQRALPLMIAAGGGVVLNMSSVNGLSNFGNVAYSAAKAGLISLTQTVANQFGKDGIRSVCVAPGSVRTEVWDRRIDSTPGILDLVASHYPLGRIGTTDDIANALLFLASDEASWISGVTIPVEGGILSGNLAMSRELEEADQ